MSVHSRAYSEETQCADLPQNARSIDSCIVLVTMLRLIDKLNAEVRCIVNNC